MEASLRSFMLFYFGKWLVSIRMETFVEFCVFCWWLGFVGSVRNCTFAAESWQSGRLRQS